MRTILRPIMCSLLVATITAPARASNPADSVIAIVGATVIDGNGGPPLRDAVVLITGRHITTVGARADVKIPKGAKVVLATGQYLVPGFIDTNVHVSLYSRL
ncbi:MAG TPA: hypothetical protein VF368_03325, partial [Gemmatimonadaceae bacterium]